MNIIRLGLTSKFGRFLIDAEHENKELVRLRIHPICGNVVGPAMGEKTMEGMDALVSRVKKMMLDLPD